MTDQAANGYAAYLRPADGSPPVRLGEGDGYPLSPDGRWVIALTQQDQRRIVLHPTGPGQTKVLPNPESLDLVFIRWLADGRMVMFGAPAGAGAPSRLRPRPQGGPAPPVHARRRRADALLGHRRLAGRHTSGRARSLGSRQRLSRGRRSAGALPNPEARRPPPGVDRRRTGASRRERLRATVADLRRHEIASGRETPVTEVAPSLVAGGRMSWMLDTPDGRYWAHSYSRILVDVYLAEGLR